MLGCYIPCPDILKYNYPFVWYYKASGTWFDPPDSLLWRIKYFRVSNYDDILFKWINIFDNQCLILYPVNFLFEYSLQRASDFPIYGE